MLLHGALASADILRADAAPMQFEGSPFSGAFKVQGCWPFQLGYLLENVTDSLGEGKLSAEYQCSLTGM